MDDGVIRFHSRCFLQLICLLPSTNHFSSQKTRINVLSYGIQIWTNLSFVLLEITHVTDGQTDRWTESSSLDRVCITCNAVKINDGVER